MLSQPVISNFIQDKNNILSTEFSYYGQKTITEAIFAEQDLVEYFFPMKYMQLPQYNDYGLLIRGKTIIGVKYKSPAYAKGLLLENIKSIQVLARICC